MKKYGLIIFLSWSIRWLVSGVCRRIKSETIKTFHYTGVAIAVDDMIQQYEREHQQFYKEETKHGVPFEWLALDDKNLSSYCNEYIELSIPRRNSDGATGEKIRKLLYYEKENTTTSEVVVVRCQVLLKNHKYTYYITRAPKPNCVYTLQSKGRQNQLLILTIINKCCDFEDNLFTSRCQKRKRIETSCATKHTSGQPIAKDEYLLKYELDHQKLLIREGNNGEHIVWSYATLHPNLNYYCYQYMRECVPNRNPESVTGSWKIERLHYQKLNTNNDVIVIAVKCQIPGGSKLSYLMTRALETNCVYAVRRMVGGPRNYFVIVYKHCDFEDPYNQETISQDYDVHVKNVIPKTEANVEAFGKTSETLKLFPQD